METLTTVNSQTENIQIYDESFNAFRERLYGIVTELKKKETPRKHVKKRGDGFDYPDFAYMVEEMDKFHPNRKEEFAFQPQIIGRNAILVGVIVSDNITHEIRVGIDAHRLTFKKGEEKNPDNVIDIGNDAKSALTEALRNAYSRFGVCADVYNKQLQVGPSPENIKSLESMYQSIKQYTTVHPHLKKWWNQVVEDFDTQTPKTVEEFLSSIQTQVNTIIKKYSNSKTIY